MGYTPRFNISNYLIHFQRYLTFDWEYCFKYSWSTDIDLKVLDIWKIRFITVFRKINNTIKIIRINKRENKKWKCNKLKFKNTSIFIIIDIKTIKIIWEIQNIFQRKWSINIYIYFNAINY